MLKKLLLILLLIKFSFPAVSGKQAITDTLSFSSLNTFVTNLGDSVVAWKLNKSRPLTANLVIPKTQKFSIASGVKLDLAGYTLTIKNGGEFGDSCIVGSSGTVVFDTCSVLEFHTSWIGSSGIVCHWRGCNRDTSKVTTFQASNAGIGSLSTTLHLNDSTYGRTERLTGKSYAAGGYNGDLTGTAQYSDSCKNGAARSNTAKYADSAGSAKRVENGMYTNGSYPNPSSIPSLAGSKITGRVDSSRAATIADSTRGGSLRSITSNISDSSRVARSVNGGTVDATRARLDTMYLDGDLVYKLPLAHDSVMQIDPGFSWALGSEIGWIFGNNSTGMAIYNNKIVDRGGNSCLSGFKLADVDSIRNRIILTQIISSAGDLEIGAIRDFIADIGGVTNWYSTDNMNLESIDGDLNVQSDNGAVHIASYSDRGVSISADTVIMNGTVIISDSISGRLKGESDSAITSDTARNLSGGTVNSSGGTFTGNVDINARLTVRQFVGAEGSLTSASLTKDLSMSPRTFYTANGSYQWTFINASIGTVIYVYNPSSSTVSITLNSDNTSKYVMVPQGHVVQLICVSSSSTYWLWSAWQTTKSYLD